MDHGSRLLIYSHDSFGLGHLRRCRAIAHHLVERFKGLSVLILSGSPIIGSFDFRSRVDFVRVPGVIKLRNGAYTSLNLHLDIEETLEIRRSIIHHTAEMFAPDLFLVDKEPLGLRGEVRSTLEMLRARGVRCVLGLRDVMDEPASLVDEWRRKGVFPALDRLYDEIWVYGLPQVFDPLREIPGMAALASRVRFTGYLRRTSPDGARQQPEHPVPEEPYILVTPGGGGDGAELVDWVLRAYESDLGLPHRAVLLLGPFMPVDQRLGFQARAARDPRLAAITFEARVEPFFARARAIVAMGGYNTFCEILSFGKPALLVPRTTPRLEQFLRAGGDGEGPARSPGNAGPRRAGSGSHAAGAGADHGTCGSLAGACQAAARASPQPVRLTALPRRVAILVKGYPRLSETFIVQEILALERLGLDLEIVSLRHPTDGRIHPLHEAIRAQVRYLPEYLYQEPWRVLRSFGWVARHRAFWRLLRVWLRDLVRDPTPNRGRRLGQACVLAAELPDGFDWLHVHYLHTPASVARYAAILRGLPYSISAHAKDVWTIPEWEKREKIADASWLVTCSRMNLDHLRALAPEADLELVHHGLDAGRFPAPDRRRGGDGRDPAQPVGIVCVARAVEKKGLDVLLAALARLPPELHWRFEHVGGGPLAAALEARAERLGIAARVRWRGAGTQEEVVAALRRADIFALAARVASDGDRDGLPNVIMEAMSQELPVVATWAGAIEEVVADGLTGRLVAPEDADALAEALARLIADPALRQAMGEAGRRRILERFAFADGIARLAARFGLSAGRREAA